MDEDAQLLDRDEAAAGRLRQEIERLYRSDGKRYSKNAVSGTTGIARPTLDGYLEDGVLPTRANMAKLANAAGTDPVVLWRRYFDIGDEGGLDRIADEIRSLREALAGDPERAEARRLAIERARTVPVTGPEDDPPAVPGASSRRGRPGGGTRPR